MDLPPDRRYTEDEVRAIFQETARRQASVQAADSPGLTLDELMEVARDTGLDPRLVAAAAAHLGRPETRTSRFWDVPENVQDDRVLPGLVSDELWEQIVDELRRTFGDSGQAGQVGRIREWTLPASGSEGAIHAEVRPEKDQTRIVLTQSLAAHRKTAFAAPPFIAALGVLLTFVVLAAGGLTQWPVMILVATIHFGIAFSVAFGAHRAATLQYRRQSKRFEHVLDRVDLLALRTASSATRPMEAASLDSPVGDDLDSSVYDALEDARRRHRARE